MLTSLHSVFIRSDSTRFVSIRFAEFIETEHTPFAIWVREVAFSRTYIFLTICNGVDKLFDKVEDFGAAWGNLGALWDEFR